MQITVKSTKVAKTGTNKAGPWELIVITSEDGTDYTTFHKGAKNLTAGAVIDIEPDIKEGKISFKEYKVISSPAAPPDGNGRPGMTPELWAEKDRLERQSIESQVAFKGVVQIICAYIDKGVSLEKYHAVATDWAMARLQQPSEAVKAFQTPNPAEKALKVSQQVGQDIEELWPEDSHIDMDWLKESLETLRSRHLRAWYEESLLSYMLTTYKVVATTVLGAAVELDKGQAAHFCKAIQGALDKSNQ